MINKYTAAGRPTAVSHLMCILNARSLLAIDFGRDNCSRIDYYVRARKK